MQYSSLSGCVVGYNEAVKKGRHHVLNPPKGNFIRAMLFQKQDTLLEHIHTTTVDHPDLAVIFKPPRSSSVEDFLSLVREKFSTTHFIDKSDRGNYFLKPNDWIAPVYTTNDVIGRINDCIDKLESWLKTKNLYFTGISTDFIPCIEKYFEGRYKCKHFEVDNKMVLEMMYLG